MSYEKKALGSLDKIVDAIFYEEGRLAIINKYGASLDDADKVKATELITKQRANLDRLFSIYKEQLDPVMLEINNISEEMELFIGKLLLNANVSEQVISQEQVEETKAADDEVNVSEPVIEAVVSDSVDSSSAEENKENSTPEEPVMISESVSDSSDSAVSQDAVEEASVNPLGDPAEFVISADEKKPENSEEKAIEEGAIVVDQQLQAIDDVKQEIINNPDLTAEEKAVEMEKYTRVSDNAVKAILVTKIQYEKLLASKNAQKALFNPEKQVVTEDVKEDSPVAILPVIGEVPVAENVSEEKTSTEDTSVVAPVVEATPAAETKETTAIMPVGELINNELATTDAVDKQKELQTMIEQANTLYKEGKTEEAQQIFDKVGAINKEIQGDANTSVEGALADNTSGNTLVKK